MNKIKIIECPRDAMQGISDFIPTKKKIDYLNLLLQLGFDTIDFGSFVSPKSIPQMRDTEEVLAHLNLTTTISKLLVIVANLRGAKTACSYDEIHYLGYPLSLSETFQQRNTNRSVNEAFHDLEEMQKLAKAHNKTLVVYLSMAYGNPYNDPYEMDYVTEFVNRLDNMEVNIISLADTIGVSNPKNIATLFETLIPTFPHIEFGAHLHTTPQTTIEKLEATYQAGCRRIDGAIKGLGGCPLAKEKLTGNMATEKILLWFDKMAIETKINKEKFSKTMGMISLVFGK